MPVRLYQAFRDHSSPLKKALKDIYGVLLGMLEVVLFIALDTFSEVQFFIKK